MKGMLIFTLFPMLLITSCKSGSVTNSVDVPGSSSAEIEFSGMTVQIDTSFYEHSTGQLVARGRVANIGSWDVTHSCLIEGTFYSDCSCETELGNDVAYVGPISSGREAGWKLSFSSSDADLSQYEGFTVANFRIFTGTDQR